MKVGMIVTLTLCLAIIWISMLTYLSNKYIPMLVKDCENKGGELIATSRLDYLCLKKGTVIK